MHHLPRFFSYRSSMSSKGGRRKPRLDRRNAAKHIDYDATSFSSSLDDSSSSSSLITRSLDLSDKTSFRIQGTDGEFDLICRTLGLSGPEDFSIPSAAWEARKIRSSSSDVLPRSKLNRLDSPEEETDKIKDGTQVIVSELADRVLATDLTEDDSPELKLNETDKIKDDTQVIVSELADRVLTTDLTEDGSPELKLNECCRADRGLVDVATTTELKSNACWALNVSDGGGSNGIKGARPPVLKPPPVMKLQVVDNACSTWDLFRDFAPEDDKVCMAPVQLHSSSDEEEVKGEESGGNEENGREENLMGIGETATLSESCLYATSNDDDSSSSTTEPTSNISPNGRFKRTITYWEKGELLGRGSFGSVFEGISDDGFFFAVKEVSLLDQGSQGKQSIIQLEHEIALLSQFEHENIVQYYGTDKDDSKLYIFLELVTKGSLLNLYQRYHLIDSQVSAYTRQILHGLRYLHDRNVVHRDVKCANILVDASGSVKLADFGLAKAIKLNDVKSCKGTAFWMAPEVVNQKGHGYGLPADIWSLGCTVLEMLTHQIPYHYLECMQALFRIGRGQPPAVPDSLSEDARDFILQCLQVNPDARPTAAVLLQHPFVKRTLPARSGSTSPHIGRRS